jgi:predicted MFS family arabinose efflux permease
VPSERTRRNRAPVFFAIGVTTFGPLPVFFLGSLAVLVRRDLEFSEAALGATIAVFFLFAAVGSAPAGRFADRLGARRALRIGLATTFLALACLAFVNSWWQLPLALAVAGLGHATLQVGSNLFLANHVAPGTQGLAFGIKQSTTAVATLAAGAAVPFIGTQLGWRWAYGFAAVAAATVWALQGRLRHEGTRSGSTQSTTDTRPRAFTQGQLLTVAVAVAFAAGAANTLPSFLVEFAASVGVSLDRGGTVLAVASAFGIAVRVLAGRLADVHGRADLPSVTVMLLAGGLGFAALPMASSDSLLLWVAGCVAFGAGWGWPGLLIFIVARDNAHAPAAATGATQAGIFAGAVAGPLFFGITVSALSYTVAWLGAAIAQLIGAALLIAIRWSRRRLPAAPGT